MADIVFLTSAAAAVLAMIWTLVAADVLAAARLSAKSHPEKTACSKSNLC